MYKCRDCGKEYIEQVDYCECGNNTFDFVEDVEFETDVLTNKKKQISRDDKISWLIFLLCIISSFYILFFVGNVKETKRIVQKAVPSINSNSIPKIDDFWDDTPLVVKQKPINQSSADVQVIEQNNEINSSKFEEPVFVKEVFKPVVKPVVKPVQKVKNSVKNSQQIQKPNKVQNTSLNLPYNSKVTEKPKATDYNNPDFIAYKKSLMQRMFLKFPVGGIRGDGVCIVSFKISDSGKLLNRKFEIQSDNKTLNDAVYYMMMSVSTFNPPPESYHGDTLKLKIIFENNTYEFRYI